ncbi:MAG: hypothetical protein ACUZ8O_10090 [Candidatus Anammoxibacter sp.]
MAKDKDIESRKKLVIFQSKEIRRLWHENEWVFSVIDIVAALTDSANPRDYWYKMKIRVKEEDGFEPSTVCRQLKMEKRNLDNGRLKTKNEKWVKGKGNSAHDFYLVLER